MLKCFDDFIYFKDDVLNQDQIDDILNFVYKNNGAFEQFRMHQIKNEIDGAPNKETTREDKSYFMSPHFNAIEHLDWICQVVDTGWQEYHQQYKFIRSGNAMEIYWHDFKHHIVEKHGGYHTWHHERGAMHEGISNRVLVWHLSLTTHENEGELEFLYLGHRIEPKAGRLLIWPAGFTHVHRGNPIRTDTEKHYITGWFLMN